MFWVVVGAGWSGGGGFAARGQDLQGRDGRLLAEPMRQVRTLSVLVCEQGVHSRGLSVNRWELFLAMEMGAFS